MHCLAVVNQLVRVQLTVWEQQAAAAADPVHSCPRSSVSTTSNI